MAIEYDEDDVLLKKGVMWKRRNGAGKYTFYPWETRFFTLTTEGVLSYYEMGASPVTRPPRGSMDLSKMDFELQRTPNIESVPPNTFSIQICPVGVGGEKWKMAAVSQIDHDNWCTGTTPAAPTSPCLSLNTHTHMLLLLSSIIQSNPFETLIRSLMNTFSLSLSLSLTHTHTHTRVHATLLSFRKVFARRQAFRQ